MSEWPKYEINNLGIKEWKNAKGEWHRKDGPAVEWPNGNKYWYLNDKHHRKDGPAVERANGDKLWFINGELHREDGPAVENADGTKEYFLNGIQVGEKDLPMNKKDEWPKCKISIHGDKFWTNKEEKLHRADGPAMELANGNKCWYKNGLRHREDGPACEFANGSKQWIINGELHREDGPAIEFENGYKAWYINGKRHRIDGPAVEYANGDKEWYKNGQLHREDGPAIEEINGDNEYWLNGKKVNEKDLPMNKKEEWPKCEIDKDGHKVWLNKNGKYHRLDGPAIEFVNGDKWWFKNGKCHREDGPAMEKSDGTKEWYRNGLHHRKDGPAYEGINGDKEWIINGEYHRKDGPAREFANGDKEWWINGVEVEEKDLPMNKIKYKVLKDGSKIWANGGNYHREDGPAIEWANGAREWWINGLCHREDGPAVEWPDGSKEYYLNGERIEEKDLPMNKNKEESKCKVLKNGTKKWYKGRKLHRLDGPAVECVDGTKEWRINGQFHREDGPAIECSNGDKFWYINGMIHREDGPAKEFVNGDKHWYKNDQLHREDGPAIENSNGNKQWRINGQLHREDGPAMEWLDGGKEYWLNNIRVEEKDLPMNKGKELLTKEEWPKCEIDNSGNKRWKNEKGLYHREDGPACEFANGSKQWIINGQFHREDGPAVECVDGDKEYYLNGKIVDEKDLPINKGKELLTKEEWPKCEIDEYGTKTWVNEKNQYHRLHHPAIECINGDKEWWINDKRHREDGPACECSNGYKAWYKNGELHREDGPACEYANGNKSWWLNGLLHREDGPAAEYTNGNKEWYLNGKKLSAKEVKVKFLLKDDGLSALNRVLCKQLVKIIKNAIITALNITSKPQLKAVSEFLNSKIGTSFVTYIAGLSLSQIKSNKVDKISRELRVEGLSMAGTELIDVLFKNIFQMKYRIEDISNNDQFVLNQNQELISEDFEIQDQLKLN